MLMQTFRVADPVVDATLVRSSSLAVVASISSGECLLFWRDGFCTVNVRGSGVDL